MSTFTTLIASLWIASATAASPSPSPAVDQLDHPDYQQRHETAYQLLRDDTLSLEDFKTLYAAAQSIEQQHRILNIAKHHTLRQLQQNLFTNNDIASVGVSHVPTTAQLANGIEQPAIQIVLTIPGFPGYAHLRPGDLITAYNDQPFPDNLSRDMFTQLIRQQNAGKPIVLTVYRDDQLHTVRFHLASATALGQMYHSQNLELQPPFRQHWLDAYRYITSQTETAPQAPSPAALSQRIDNR